MPFNLYSEGGVSSCAVFFVTFALAQCLPYRETEERGAFVSTTLKKTVLAVFPLAGLLAAAPVTFAHERGEHAAIHQDLGNLHDDFHQRPHSRREHRRFHKELKREHRALDRGLRNDWGYGYGRSYGGDYYGNSPYDRYGYRGRRSYGDRW
jgi:hypothetical protein